MKNTAGVQEKLGGKENSIRNAMTQPEWATPIIKEICFLYTRKLPKMKWMKRNRTCTSGVCYSKHIVICAGTDLLNQKQVLLHELAHWILAKRRRRGRRYGHSVRFYKLLFDLLKYYECFEENYLTREFNYKSTAQYVYRQITV